MVVRLAWERDTKWLEAAVAGEVGRPGITQAELSDLEHPIRRLKAQRAMRRRAGLKAAMLLKQLHRQQINLVMVRTRVEADDDPDLVRQRERCAAIRAQLAAIPRALPG